MSLLQGREHLNERLTELRAKLAPTDEPAESVAGELIRAVCRIVDSFYSDHAMLGRRQRHVQSGSKVHLRDAPGDRDGGNTARHVESDVGSNL